MVKIVRNGSLITISAQYNSEFNNEAKKIGGTWDVKSKVWAFDIRDELRLRSLCLNYYGSDGIITDTCTLRIEWIAAESSSDNSALIVNGRPIALAKGRDTGANTCNGIIVIQGEFNSGGTWKDWQTTVKRGTVVLVRDFPRQVAEKLLSKVSTKRIYAIEDESQKVDPVELRAESERLVVRLREIDALIAEA